MKAMQLLCAAKWKLSLLLFAWCCDTFARSQSCDRVRSTVETLQGAQPTSAVVYDQLELVTSSFTTCQLQSTCCSTTAEDVLLSDVATRYQTSLETILHSNVPQCIGNTLNSKISSYLSETKAFIIGTVQILTGSSYNDVYDTLFDSFFAYLENAIISKNLCEAEMQFQQLYFEVYLTGFTGALTAGGGNTAILNDADFRSCFYQFFLQEKGDDLLDDYVRFKQRMNLLLRVVVAMETSDAVLGRVVNHNLSPECHDSLLRLTHCAECAGINDESVLPCEHLCQNVLRGCTVDVYELGDVYNDLYCTMKDARVTLDAYDPFGAILLINFRVINLLTDFLSGLSPGYISDVESMCSVNLRRKRSSLSVPMKHRNVKRQGTQTPPETNPLEAIDDAISCAEGVSDLLQNLNNELCPANAVDSDNMRCWNGSTVGSYNTLPSGKDRISQADNPELKLLSNTGLLYKDSIAQLKNVTAELRECADAAEHCEVRLCGLAVPSPSDFDLTSEPRYQPFDIPGVEPMPVSPIVSTSSPQTALPYSSSRVVLPSAVPTTTGTVTVRPSNILEATVDIVRSDPSGSAGTYLSVAVTVVMTLTAMLLL